MDWFFSISGLTSFHQLLLAIFSDLLFIGFHFRITHHSLSYFLSHIQIRDFCLPVNALKLWNKVKLTHRDSPPGAGQGWATSILLSSFMCKRIINKLYVCVCVCSISVPSLSSVTFPELFWGHRDRPRGVRETDTLKRQPPKGDRRLMRCHSLNFFTKRPAEIMWLSVSYYRIHGALQQVNNRGCEGGGEGKRW